MNDNGFDIDKYVEERCSAVREMTYGTCETIDKLLYVKHKYYDDMTLEETKILDSMAVEVSYNYDMLKYHKERLIADVESLRKIEIALDDLLERYILVNDVED